MHTIQHATTARLETIRDLVIHLRRNSQRWSTIREMEDTVPPIAALALPIEEDILPVLNAKLSSFLYVLHVNRCIAAATRSTFNETHETPEARAKRQMKHHEQEYFQAWKDGTLQRLPHIDWDIDRGRTPTSKHSLKKAERRAEALNRSFVPTRLRRASTSNSRRSSTRSAPSSIGESVSTNCPSWNGTTMWTSATTVAVSWPSQALFTMSQTSSTTTQVA
jgi:hypothetical protein